MHDLLRFSLAGISSFALFSCSQQPSLIDVADTSFDIPSHLPTPPIGYRWMLVEQMSDEFHGHKLNNNKWRDHITTWGGRPPAEFLSDNVSLGNGMLQLKTSSHPFPNDTFTMGGASVSGKYDARYGYFESRLKASKTKMSTTFWLHSDEVEDKQLPCDKQHTIELDILEAIGGWPTRDWTHLMHSNTHYKPREMQNGRCAGPTELYLSQGVKHDTGVNLSDDFHTFALWWVTPNQMHYYFDGKITGTVNLNHVRDSLPFSGPMSLRMVVETYTWQQKIIPDGMEPYPTLDELDDSDINTAFYDYVRTYELRPTKTNRINNGDFEGKHDVWSIEGDAQISSRAGHSYNADYGLHIDGQSAVHSASVPLVKGEKYRVSAYVKYLRDEVNGFIDGQLSLTNKMGKVLGKSQIVHQTQHVDDFFLVQFEFENQTSEQGIIEVQGHAMSSFVLDDISILALP